MHICAIIFTYIYICIYLCIYIYTYRPIEIFTYGYIPISIYFTNMKIYIDIFLYTCTYTEFSNHRFLISVV